MSGTTEHAGQVEPDRLVATLQRLMAITAVDVTTALGEAAGQLAQALRADKVDAFLHDPATDTLVALGVSDTAMGRHQRSIGLDRMPVANGGRAVEVFLTGIPYHNGRVDEDAAELLGIRESLGARSEVIVALEVGGQRRGALGVASTERDRFTEQDLHFLGAVAGWVGLVAQRAELIGQLTRQASEQGRREAADELIAVLAHDLGNRLQPLRSRIDFIRMIAQRTQQEAILAHAESAVADATRLARLIDDLLDTARLEHGLFALDQHPVDLVALAREAAHAFATETVPIEVAAPDQLIVAADPDRLRQVLENLLSNAARHSPGGQPVTVEVATTRRDGRSWATVRVADRGPGVPPQALPRLFERFGRGPGSRGLGLGLYLARRIIREHGGELAVDAAPGVGGIFVLTLPM
jgi:two-component system, OmpR family, sensor kinase